MLTGFYYTKEAILVFLWKIKKERTYFFSFLRVEKSIQEKEKSGPPIKGPVIEESSITF